MSAYAGSSKNLKDLKESGQEAPPPSPVASDIFFGDRAQENHSGDRAQDNGSSDREQDEAPVAQDPDSRWMF